MKLEHVVVGPISTNCYCVDDEAGHCVVVDPGWDAEAVLRLLAGRVPDWILLTHRHHDHIGAVNALVEATGAPVAAHGIEAELLTNARENRPLLPGYKGNDIKVSRCLREGDVVEAGNLRFKVLHTPGHTAGSVCFYEAQEGILLAGDTLFFGGCGRTDFDSGSMSQMEESLRRLGTLPDEVQVYPGHDRFTSIAAERRRGLLG